MYVHLEFSSSERLSLHREEKRSWSWGQAVEVVTFHSTDFGAVNLRKEEERKKTSSPQLFFWGEGGKKLFEIGKCTRGSNKLTAIQTDLTCLACCSCNKNYFLLQRT